MNVLSLMSKDRLIVALREVIKASDEYIAVQNKTIALLMEKWEAQ
jgi:hypothetical protein